MTEGGAPAGPERDGFLFVFALSDANVDMFTTTYQEKMNEYV